MNIRLNIKLIIININITFIYIERESCVIGETKVGAVKQGLNIGVRPGA